MTECTKGGSDPKEIIASTVEELEAPGNTGSSGNKTLPLLLSVIRQMAAFVFPWNMRFEKERANFESATADVLGVCSLY